MKRLLPLLVVCATNALAAPTLVPTPALPTYGKAVGVELQGAPFPVFLPGTRYTRNGNNITLEYEYAGPDFGPAAPVGPQFGSSNVKLGELPPGNYTVTARLFDIDHPQAAQQTITTNIAVVPPDDWGLYAVPQAPLASDRVQMLVRSAVYFDPATVKASVSGNTIRVDFAYHATAPVGGPVPPGMTSFASIDVGRLAPGTYHAEGWAHPDTGGDSQRYFTLDFNVAPESNVTEFYHEKLDHYFMTASGDEMDGLDAGAGGGWKRTGQTFHAWLRAQDAPAGAQPVCRFYAAGPNSHFYTGSATDCANLRTLEQAQRAEAAALGQPFLGWGFEYIAFYALVPVNGQCPGGTSPVWRSYNDRAMQNDTNHRFTVEPQQHLAMQGWIDEGPAFCSPQ